MAFPETPRTRALDSAMEKHGPKSFSSKFTNRGKIPGEVIDIKQRETCTELMDPDKREWPVPPNYGLEPQFVPPRTELKCVRLVFVIFGVQSLTNL
jgi:hypothetical protein